MVQGLHITQLKSDMHRKLTGTWQTADNQVWRLLQDEKHQTDVLLARIDNKAYPTIVISARHDGSLTSLAQLLIEERQSLDVLIPAVSVRPAELLV